MLLRQLHEAGVLQGQVLAFTSAHRAVSMGARLGREVMVVHDAGHCGCYWVVEEPDATRLEAAGYTRHCAWVSLGGHC
jgi:hypothetical protein